MKTIDRNSQTWAELGVDMFDKLTDKKAHIVYSFENFEVSVPDRASEYAKSAPWKLNGTLRIHTHKEHGSAS